MNIELVKSCFSRFNEGVIVQVRSDGTTVQEDISKKELIPFAEMLIDIADDVLRKYSDDKCDNARDHLSKAMEALR